MLVCEKMENSFNSVLKICRRPGTSDPMGNPRNFLSILSRLYVRFHTMTSEIFKLIWITKCARIVKFLHSFLTTHQVFLRRDLGNFLNNILSKIYVYVLDSLKLQVVFLSFKLFGRYRTFNSRSLYIFNERKKKKYFYCPIVYNTNECNVQRKIIN